MKTIALAALPRVFIALAALIGCSAPPASPPASTSSVQAQASPTPSSSGSAAAPDPGCTDQKGVEKIEIAQGATVRTSLDVAVTFDGSEHDNYEGGRTDLLVKLTFQGVLEDGKLTPSAFSWMPSLFAPPRWINLGSMPLCVRLSDASADRVTLELYRAPSRGR